MNLYGATEPSFGVLTSKDHLASLGCAPEALAPGLPRRRVAVDGNVCGAAQRDAAADEPLAFARVSQQSVVTLGGRQASFATGLLYAVLTSILKQLSHSVAIAGALALEQHG
jgi:hypothetical protein